MGNATAGEKPRTRPLRAADEPYTEKDLSFLRDQDPETLTDEQWRSLPLDPDPQTRGKGFPSIQDPENVHPNTFDEARLLFATAGLMRSIAENKVLDAGQELDIYAFDEETMRTGKNFREDPQNTIYSLTSQIEWAMSRVMWGFVFCGHHLYSKEEGDHKHQLYRRDPKVQDAFGFARISLRNLLPDFLISHRSYLDNAQANASRQQGPDAVRTNLRMLENAELFLGVQLDDPEEDAADAQRRFPAPPPMQ